MCNAVANCPDVQLSSTVYIPNLEFANNVIVLGDSPATMQAISDRITRYAAKVDSEINTRKQNPSQPSQYQVANNFSPTAIESVICHHSNT